MSEGDTMITRDKIPNMPAGEEIDTLIAERIMGEPKPTYTHTDFHLYPEMSVAGNWYCVNDYEHGDICEWHPRAFSSNISAAWDVAEMLRQSQGNPIEIKGDEWYDGGAWQVNIYDLLWGKITASSKDETSGPNRNPPNVCLAICRAALLARRWTENE